MKDQVLNFLGDLPQAGSKQFNQALELYRKTKGHDIGKLKFFNRLGFSQDRLESLLYDLKKLHSVSDLQLANAKRISPLNSPLTPEGGTSETSENGSEDPGNDTEKETLEITSEELGTKELSEKFEEHISVNQIDVNEEKDVSTSLDETDPSEEVRKGKIDFIQKLVDFNLEDEKYNSIKSFAAEVSDFTGKDPKDQKGDTLKAFVAEAKKKLV